MKKINKFTYEVQAGEQITIEVTPTDFGNNLPSVEAEMDGAALTNSGTTDAPVFSLTVTKPVGDIHRVLMEFTFLQGTPDNSFYQIAISGQNDEGCPCGFTIKKTTQVKDPSIAFEVV